MKKLSLRQSLRAPLLALGAKETFNKPSNAQKLTVTRMLNQPEEVLMSLIQGELLGKLVLLLSEALERSTSLNLQLYFFLSEPFIVEDNTRTGAEYMRVSLLFGTEIPLKDPQ